MSDIDRLFQHLARTIQANFPAYLHQPFEVAELYQNILPYRHHRRELGFDTNQDYELAMTELLSGAGGYLVVDDRMRDALQRELASRNPDPGAFREFASSHVSLNPDAVARVIGPVAGTKTPSPFAPRTPERRSAAAPASAAPTPAVPPPVASPSASPPRATRPSLTPSPPPMATPTSSIGRQQTGITPAPGDTCGYCGGALPAGRRLTFCPHCGQNLTVVNCPACGTELELGWKFCPTCGRPAATT